MWAIPDTRSRASGRCFEGAPSVISEAKYSKHARISTNRRNPPCSPAHPGPCAHPRPKTNRDEGSQQRARGAAANWSVHTGRQEALTAQIRAFGCLFCAAQIHPVVNVSAGGFSTIYVLMPPALIGGPEDQHMAEAGTADGLAHARTKNVAYARNSARMNTSASLIYTKLKYMLAINARARDIS